MKQTIYFTYSFALSPTHTPGLLNRNGGTHVIALKIEPLHNVCKHFKKNDVVRMYTKSSDVCFIVSVFVFCFS